MKKYIVFLSVILCQYTFSQDTPLEKFTTSNIQDVISKIPSEEDIESQLTALNKTGILSLSKAAKYWPNKKLTCSHNAALEKFTTSNLQDVILKTPSEEDIESQLAAITEMENQSISKVVQFRPTQDLTDSLIADLTPIIFMGICPDSLNNKKIDIRFYNDCIILWSPTGFYYHWDYVPLSYRKYNLHTKGVKERTEHIKKVINDLLPRKYLITISLFPRQRYYYPYIGYYENDKLVIFNDHGERYNSIDELLIDEFGSIEKYIETYKRDVH